MTPRYTRQASGRRNRRQQTLALLLLIAVAVIYLVGEMLISRDKEQRTTQIDGALTTVVTAPGLDEQIIRYKGFVVSFNPTLHIPNWVAWELTADEVASNVVARSNKFRTDTSVDGCANTADYTRSGYDRGHMAPAADMSWDAVAMDESFLLTNIAPQDHRLNGNSWRRLEDKCRKRAERDSVVVVVCGPVPGDKPVEYIGATGVAVPQRFFKAIISPYANPPRGIAFVMPNSDVPGGMQACATTIDQVEALTGHDFFSALPDDLEAELESQNNFNTWSRLK